MILSLIAWLAMWGQVKAQTPDLSQLTDPGIVRPLKTDPHVSWDEDPAMLGDNHAPSKPAEQVIEIKTVRSHPDHETSDWRECGADDEVVLANAAINGIFAVICRSTKVTREIYVDGVKFGVIKGLN